MKTLLKMFVAIAIMAMATSVSAQDDYIQYETIYLKPDTKSLGTLQANMKAHNDKYHSDTPYHANVWQVSNGPKSGWLVWTMGPCTFAENDGRPGEGGHDEDWANKVMPYITDMGSIEYWRMHQGWSSEPGGTPQPILHVRFYKANIKEGKGFLIGDLMEKMSKTMHAMPEGRSWFVYNNLFQQGDMGRHLAAITPIANWAELDNGMNLDPMAPGTFGDTFEKLYGEGSMTPFTRTMQEAFEDSYDEIWTLMPGMSAPPPEE